ncbi:leucine-rich repeat domain-containing protein, partial [Leptospira interrogans]
MKCHFIFVSIGFILSLYCSLKMTKTYHNLQDALDNPLDVLILEMSMNTRISMGLHELESLPRVIGLFQNLEKLNLDGNQLTS